MRDESAENPFPPPPPQPSSQVSEVNIKEPPDNKCITLKDDSECQSGSSVHLNQAINRVAIIGSCDANSTV